MSERQDIDRLFQERFKDFEAAPSDKIWANIQRQMNKEEEVKKAPFLLPLWVKLCGVAAVFLIGFSVGNSYLFSPKDLHIDGANQTVSDDTNKDTKINNKDNTRILENQLNSAANTDLVNVDDNAITKSESAGTTTAIPSGLEKNSVKNQNNTSRIGKRSANSRNNNPSVAFEAKKQHATSSETSTDKNSVIPNTYNPSIAISEDKKESVNTDNNIAFKKVIPTENIVAGSTNSVKNSSEYLKENSADLLYQNNNSKVAFEVGKERYTNLSDRGIQAKTPNKNNTVAVNSQTTTIVKEEKLLKKSILPKTLGVTSADSSQLAKGKENPLDQLLKEKEDESKKEDKNIIAANKWVVSSKATPVFMGASGKNSALDQQFDNNSRNYKTTFSYGMGVSYAVTDKLSVRTGINSVNLEYNTNDILYYESTTAQNLQNVRRNETASIIQVEDKDSRKLALSEGNIVTQKSSGALSQRMGYIEVPTEISYKLLNKKFGIEVIGGLSTLFLTQNEVSIVSDRQEMKIGEASNLNDIHLSSNIGLGFCYKFNKSLEANMEPMFKYQINTFRNNSGDFKPYYMGVFTGISYRF